MNNVSLTKGLSKLTGNKLYQSFKRTANEHWVEVSSAGCFVDETVIRVRINEIQTSGSLRLIQESKIISIALFFAMLFSPHSSTFTQFID